MAKMAAPETRGTNGNLLSVTNTMIWNSRYRMQWSCLFTENAYGYPP